MAFHMIYYPWVDENSYLIAQDDSGAAALIDPGSDRPHDWRDIQELLGRDRARLEYILLTHGHYDHVSGVPDLCRAFSSVPVYVHAADWALSDADPRLFPLKPLMEEAGLTGRVKFYGEGDALPLGPDRLEVLHTPGHTPGSVCLRWDCSLFTGDTLFAGSMGRTDLEGGDTAAMAASLKRLGELEGEIALHPGHGESTTLARERKHNPYLHMALEGRL